MERNPGTAGSVSSFGPAGVFFFGGLVACSGKSAFTLFLGFSATFKKRVNKSVDVFNNTHFLLILGNTQDLFFSPQFGHSFLAQLSLFVRCWNNESHGYPERYISGKDNYYFILFLIILYVRGYP